MWAPEKLREIRLAELKRVLTYFPSGSRVLELGAGAGWQARELHCQGFEVEAIEYAHPGFRNLAKDRIWPIRDYDGHQIPFQKDSFDVVFSSNVLEHIPHVCEFQREIQRVLKPHGVAIHLMPTATWRLWSTLAHYGFGVRRLYTRTFCKADGNIQDSRRISSSVSKVQTRKSQLQKLAWFLVPERHGEFGNFVTEIAYFTRWRWRYVFRNAGFQIRAEGSNWIFYSGYAVFGASIPLWARERLARILGGSCRFWVLSQSRNSGCHD